MSWIADNPVLFAIGFLVVVAGIATAFGLELPDRKPGGGEGAIGDGGDGGDGGGD